MGRAKCACFLLAAPSWADRPSCACRARRAVGPQSNQAAQENAPPPGSRVTGPFARPRAAVPAAAMPLCCVRRAKPAHRETQMTAGLAERRAVRTVLPVPEPDLTPAELIARAAALKPLLRQAAGGKRRARLLFAGTAPGVPRRRPLSHAAAAHVRRLRVRHPDLLLADTMLEIFVWLI